MCSIFLVDWSSLETVILQESRSSSHRMAPTLVCIAVLQWRFSLYMIEREAVDVGCSVRGGLLGAFSVTPGVAARALVVLRDAARSRLRAAIAARICTASDSASMAFPRSMTKTA